MDLKCLSCKESVTPDSVKLHYKVFLCPECHKRVERFVADLSSDIRLLQYMLVAAIRRGLLDGEFVAEQPTPNDITFDSRSDAALRLMCLLDWIGRVNRERDACQDTPSSSTPTPSLPPPSSGDGIEPSAQTLLALGRKSSSSASQ